VAGAAWQSDVALAGDDPFHTFRREMDRLFDSFGRESGSPAAGGGGAIMPSVDLSETDSGIRIKAEGVPFSWRPFGAAFLTRAAGLPGPYGVTGKALAIGSRIRPAWPLASSGRSPTCT
jgi:hypothetical protein